MKIDDNEPPLDPALILVQARLRRLMLIGGLTLGLGLVAVFIAILYRVTTGSGGGSGEPVTATLSAAAVGLAAEAELLSLAVEGNRIVAAFRDGGDTVLVTVDADTMAIGGTLRISGTGAAQLPAAP